MKGFDCFIFASPRSVLLVCSTHEDIQTYHSDLVRPPCSTKMACSKQRFSHTLCHHSSTANCFCPSSTSEPLAEHFPGRHFHVKPAKHKNKAIFVIHTTKPPLNFLGQGKQRLVHSNNWSLRGINMRDSSSNYSHRMRYHSQRMSIFCKHWQKRNYGRLMTGQRCLCCSIRSPRNIVIFLKFFL